MAANGEKNLNWSLRVQEINDSTAQGTDDIQSIDGKMLTLKKCMYCCTLCFLLEDRLQDAILLSQRT